MLIKGYSKKIIELDGIRGVACLFVIIHHYFTGLLAFKLTGVLWVVSRITSMFFLSGVDLFFVLSGFLVGGIIIDNYKTPHFLKYFFIRRVCRIFPIYFALIFSLYIGLLLFKNVAFFDSWLLERPYPIWTYLTFLQSYFIGLENACGPRWACVTWSVSIEEQFYFLTPFVFVLFGTRNAFITLLCGLVFAPFVRHYLFTHFGLYAGYMLFPARIDTILWGILLAYILRTEKWRAVLNNNSRLVLAFIVIVFITLAADTLISKGIENTWRYSLLAIGYTGVLWITLEQKLPVFTKIFRLKILRFTGLISYSIYMIHQLINGLMHGLIFNSKPLIDSWLRAEVSVFSIIIVYSISYFSYKYFEWPIREFGAKFKYKNT